MALASSRERDGRAPRWRLRAGLFVCSVLAVTACGPTATPSGSTSQVSGAPTTAATAAPSASLVAQVDLLTVAVENLGSQLYAPWLSGQENMQVVQLIGDTLTRVNKDTYTVEPGLAEAWELSTDLKTWTITLKPNIPFQDGYGTVTSDDVRFSWSQWLSADSVHGVIGEQIRRAVDDNIANFEVVSDLEFKLHTENPVVSLPSVLSDAAQSLTIQSKKYFDEEPEEALVHPLGTGPYRYVSNTQGVEVVLESGDAHPYRGLPASKRLVLKEIPDSAARLAQVQSGGIDIAVLDPALVGEAQAAGLGLATVKDVGSCGITLGGYYLGTPALDSDAPWIQSDAPEKGKAIRQAMSLAIDRATILDRLVAGYGALTYGPILDYPNAAQLHDPSWTPPPYDLALAKQKLVEGGYPDGFEFTFRLWEEVATGQAVADMWGELGLTVKLEITEQALMRPLFQASNQPEGNSATDGLAWLFCSSRQPSPEMALPNAWMKTGRNMQAFNPVIDEAYDDMNLAPNDDQRFAMARDLVTVLRDDGHPINLYTTDYPWVLGSKVASWTPMPGLNLFSAAETITLR